MPEINAAVLAGGMSKRFGQDKALLKFGKKTLLERIYFELSSVVGKCWIIGRNKEGLALPPELFIEDRIANAGPIGGLFTALELSDKPLFLTSCDMPFLNREHILYLIEQFDPQFPATIAVSQSGTEPLFALYQQEVLTIIEQMITSNDLALYHIFDHLKVKFVNFAHAGYISDIFFNINTLSDYKKALYLRNEFETKK